MSVNLSDETPMMQQYLRIKEKHRDAVLFFRLGDFYEMFQNDAKEVSRLLNLTLTQRHGVPMCGIPYHAAPNYIGRLLKAGKKIAVCEQITLPEKGQKLATREVVEIITPGTIIDDNYLQDNTNNYLAAISESGLFISFACIDISTSDFTATSFPLNERENLKRELFRMSPKEILVPESMAENDDYHFIFESGCFVNRFPDWYFDTQTGYNHLIKQFSLQNLKSFGLKNDDPEIVTAGALLEYISENSKSLVPHIRNLKIYSDSEYLGMDEATQKNLEIIRNLQDGSSRNTLLEILDGTRTAAGGRKIKYWLLHPMVQKSLIEDRLDKVEYLYRNQKFMTELRDMLGSVMDLERLSTRIAMNKANPKDIVSLGKTLDQVNKLSERSHKEQAPFLVDYSSRFEKLNQISKMIEASLADEPSLNITDGNVIREGYDSLIDKYREVQAHKGEILDNYLDEVRKETGIPSIRIKYNRIIGYFFEVSKNSVSQLPSYFIRRQSLVGGERFSTERLSDIESEIITSSEKIVEREKEVFNNIKEGIKPHIELILECSGLVSDIDCYQSLAYTATRNGYIRPQLFEDSNLVLKESRHPVVEKNLPYGTFVPNTIIIDHKEQPVLLVTGPNMAGKSTLLRQSALIVLMAQAGSFVPASEAFIGLADKIFCRVGASDNLARGESTFLVEMNETSYILRNATSKSLIIMDEVGRGTGTDDGLALAWSILEFLIHIINGRTFFATHYHELTRMIEPRLKNISMAVTENGKNITFLKKMVPGPANSSYGIHVASLAGIPAEVIKRAETVLETLKGSIETSGLEKLTKADNLFEQKELFNPGEPVIEQILSCEIDDMTPLQALEKISNWKKYLSKRNH